MVTVCEWFGLKTTRTVFAGLTSKLVVTVSGGLASKSAMTVFSGLTSKLVAMVFSSLASKLVATVSPGLASKPVVGFFGLVIWASKSLRRFLGLCLTWKQVWLGFLSLA
jgi:hypothetical protein